MLPISRPRMPSMLLWQGWRRRVAGAGLVLAMAASQTGCSILSPLPLWELAKGTATIATGAMSKGSTSASNTIYHLHPQFKDVCIEYNPQAEVTDMVPLLQTVLRDHGIESRVYERFVLQPQCEVWLRYVAEVEWALPPLEDQYKLNVSAFSLKLQQANGLVLSSSDYRDNGFLGRGKWASTRDKLKPVVSALLTGFQ